MKINFNGQSYQLSTPSADGQRTLNKFPVINPNETESINYFLEDTPGLSLLKSLLTANDLKKVRKIYTDSQNNLYVIVGNVFARIENNIYYNETILGVLNTEDGPVGIADNGKEIGIVDGDNYYVYDIANNTFGNFSNLPGWVGSEVIICSDQYFIFIKRNSQQFFISRPLDGKTLLALDIASASGKPDNLVNLIKYQQSLVLFGTQTIQIYSNTGNVLFPFESQNGGSYVEYGLVAKESLQIVIDSLIFLGRDRNGFGSIYIYSGGGAKKISTQAIDFAIQKYADLDKATAWSYQINSHNFYCINFSSANTTWCYDLDTDQWHERAYKNPLTGDFERHRVEQHVLWINQGIEKHIVSDYSKLKLYELDMKYFLDDTDPIIRLRQSQHFIIEDNQRVSRRKAELEIQCGEWATDEDIKLYLRISNDSGRTWSNYIECNVGKKGEYSNRAMWHRLGIGRNTVWEVTCSEPVKMNWYNFNVIVIPGVS